MPPKKTKSSAAAPVAKKARTTKKDAKEAKKEVDTRKPAVIAAENAAAARLAAMLGVAVKDLKDDRYRYVLRDDLPKKNNKNDDDDDDDEDDDEDESGGDLETAEDFAKTLCLAVTTDGIEIAASVSDKFMLLTGNEVGDSFLMFSTSSGDNALPFIGEAARRISRLIKTDPRRAFFELLGLIEAITTCVPVLHDNTRGEEFVEKMVRDLAAACRAVFRTDAATMQQDDINVSVLKQMVRELIAECTPEFGFDKVKFGCELPAKKAK